MDLAAKSAVTTRSVKSLLKQVKRIVGFLKHSAPATLSLMKAHINSDKLITGSKAIPIAHAVEPLDTELEEEDDDLAAADRSSDEALDVEVEELDFRDQHTVYEGKEHSIASL